MTFALGWCAHSFPYEKLPGRPIVSVVVLSWIASAIALLAVFVGLKVSRTQRWMSASVFLFAVAFRVILVFSNPILEVDFYRYLWDGIAANQGVSPYSFSPDEILNSSASKPELVKLQRFNAQHPSAKTILSRVHYEKYTTLYPPVSQIAFRTTTALIPDNASVNTHIVSIKLMLVLFDVGVIVCLAWLIAVLGRHPGWLIAYAWNPLVLKEIANGGHLDSIAIFFFTAGVAALLWIAKRLETREREVRGEANEKNVPGWVSVMSGGLIGLGIGAKLFPVVIVPALGGYLLARKEFAHAAGFCFSCLIVSFLVLWPMFDQQRNSAQTSAESGSPTVATNDGLAVFVTQWRMNDAIFSFVYQNVEYDWGGKDPAWYVFIPNETRIEWCKRLVQVKWANGNPAYFVSRIATVSLFASFYLWVLMRIRNTESAGDLAGLLFLIMGVFFFLQPTQNPWYWLWAMPLVCFAKNRGWLFVSMALFVYYLRFWFADTDQEYSFLSANYVGVDFFDHCIVWLEFLAVVFVLMAVRATSSATLGAGVDLSAGKKDV
jgi:hypothetical protein